MNTDIYCFAMGLTTPVPTARREMNTLARHSGAKAGMNTDIYCFAMGLATPVPTVRLEMNTLAAIAERRRG